MNALPKSVDRYGRVAVLLGGHSSEREVSLRSGSAVVDALSGAGVDVLRWDPAERPVTELASAGVDRVFIMLHGRGGEDGAIQGALQWLGIPYTGSGVCGSAIAMDKLRSKQLFDATGIPTPEYRVVTSAVEGRHVADDFEYPLIVKPVSEGSSVGMSKVFDRSDVADAMELAFNYGHRAIIERCIIGDEYSVSVLDGDALPSVRIETPRVFYDYRAKYESDSTRYHCPGTTNEEQRYGELAVRAFDVLGCTGWGRVDFMTGSDGVPQVLEVNTVPGMTTASLVPMAARAAGMDFTELCLRILDTSASGSLAAEQRRGT